MITEDAVEQHVYNSEERRHVKSSLAFYPEFLGSNIGSKTGYTDVSVVTLTPSKQRWE
jgi:hypothetical protein